MEAYPFLCSDPPEDFAEYERRFDEGEALLNGIREIVRYAVNSNLGTPEDIENLIFLFNGVEGEFYYHHGQVKARYDQAQTLGDQLIAEEDKQAELIRQRLLRREKKRREKAEKKLESQDSGSTCISADTGTVNEPEEPAPTEVEASLHPGIQAGVLAYARKQPLNKVLQEFKKVEEDAEASVFDRVQAKYGYADVVAISLQERVRILKGMAEDVKQYSMVLHSNELPSIESDLAFREALRTYKESMQELMLDTLRMSQAFKQAWDQFFTQEEHQEDFIERLIELHDEMTQLTEDGEEIAKCCANIPNIYARRGEMIQSFGLSSKGNPERRRTMAENVRVLEGDSEQVRRSFNHLKQTINIERLNKISENKPEEMIEPVVPVSLPKPVSETVPEPVLRPVQPAPLTEPAPVEARATSEVVSIPVLPPGLAKEVQQKTGRTVLASEYGTEVSVETIGFKDQQWFPDSGCDPHPLSLLARHLGNPLVVRMPHKRWYIAPGEAPVDAESLAIPKRSLLLDYDFAVKEPSAISEAIVEEPRVQTSPVAGAVASSELVESPELPLQSLIPSDICTALVRSLDDTGESWEVTASGLRKKPKEWQVVKPEKKHKKGKKGKLKKEAATPQEPEASEKPEITTLSLQGMLRKQLRLFMDDPEYCKRHVPSGFNIGGVIKRACEGRLFMEHSRLHEDVCLLSKALNIPLKVEFRPSDVFSYRPHMRPPEELGLHGNLDEDHLTLERHSVRGGDYCWVASVRHYFDWCDAQDEAEAVRLEKQKEAKVAEKAKQKEEQKKKTSAGKSSR